MRSVLALFLVAGLLAACGGPQAIVQHSRLSPPTTSPPPSVAAERTTSVPPATPTLQPPATPTPQPTALSSPSGGSSTITFNFDDDQGWVAGFADLPADFDQHIFQLESGHHPLPAGLEGSGMYLHGHNRSADLFMFIKTQVGGLQPQTTYQTPISLDLITNVPAVLMGAGGSPGESVFVKAGASTVEPVTAEDQTGWLRINIDKGNQAAEGEDMINLGDVTHPHVTGDEFLLKTLDGQDRQFEAVTDDEGRIWLIVGTDSGFEGLSRIYVSRVSYTFATV